ncbi:lytic transglycosylase domain-containing protein [Pikeienuella sp. HZG-20]|uniref:lytic transglycosylase domain-containing protein n=1 Tax=Paludibacillus litoralis TaxID=3133267 RepID=UPI0030EBA7EE
MSRLFLLIAALLAAPALASQPPPSETSAICDAAAAIGAARGPAPVEILRALTRTETGRRLDGALRPWPWTVNMEGEGFWFDSRAEALAFVKARHAEGARSFDVGCFQINFRWHGEAFASIDAMFDPVENAGYAARFLSELKAEGGDWRDAVGKYHSRTPSFAAKYTRRFDSILAALDPAPAAVVPASTRLAAAPKPPARGAWPPFFQGGAGHGGGVIVAAPAHGLLDKERANWRGGVALSAFTPGAGLLRPARPLFD